MLPTPRVVGWGMAVLAAAYLAGSGVTWLIARSGYAGAPIDSDRATVRYALGAPDLVSNDGQTWTPKGDFETAVFWRYASPHVTVAYGPETGRVTAITCLQNAGIAGAPCPGVLGIKMDDDEQAVFEALGAPSSQSISGGRKTMRFDEVGYDVVLERLRVVGVRATQSRFGYFESMGRFVIWLVP